MTDRETGLFNEEKICIRSGFIGLGIYVSGPVDFGCR